jgi:hypothetical protein
MNCWIIFGATITIHSEHDWKLSSLFQCMSRQEYEKVTRLVGKIPDNFFRGLGNIFFEPSSDAFEQSRFFLSSGGFRTYFLIVLYRVARFFLVLYTKMGKHTKWPWNITISSEIYHMAMTFWNFTKIFLCKTLENYPNWDFWFGNMPSGNLGFAERIRIGYVKLIGLFSKENKTKVSSRASMRAYVNDVFVYLI